MPERTNPFQRLIALLEYQLAPAGAIVVESGCFVDRRTRRPRQREIDVKIETREAEHRVVIAVECTARRRPADIQWIEGLFGKYHQSGAKLVAVSKSGFAEPARELAAYYDIDTLTVEEATNTSWLDWIKQLTPVEVIAVRPLPLNIVIHLTDGSSTRYTFDSPEAASFLLYGPQGDRIGTLVDFYDQVCRGDDQAAMLLFHHSLFRLPPPLELWLEATTPILIEEGEARLPVQRIVYEVDPRPERLQMCLRPGSYRGRSVGFATQTTKSWYGQISAVETSDSQEPRVDVRMRPRAKPIDPMELRFYNLPWAPSSRTTTVD